MPALVAELLKTTALSPVPKSLYSVSQRLPNQKHPNAMVKNELVRIKTADGIELQGLLAKPPKPTKSALLHVHGWVGNFYENKFIDEIAKVSVEHNYAFLSFNNRGAGFLTDFIQRKKSSIKYKRIGGSLEKFVDCIIDLRAAIEFLYNQGYKEIILQGHSLGCQKIIYYHYITKDIRIKKLILLAPVDDAAYAKKILGKKYFSSLKFARDLMKKNSTKILPSWMEFYPGVKASKFLDVADPVSTAAKLLDYHSSMKEVGSIAKPLLAVFGSRDDYNATPAASLSVLKSKANHCRTKIINRADHIFTGFEKELAKTIGKFLHN